MEWLKYYNFKGQMRSEYIYEIIDFPKYPWKDLIDFSPESLFKLGMLCTHLIRVPLRIIKTSHMYLDYKTFQGRNLSNFFGGILENLWFHKYNLTLSDIYNCLMMDFYFDFFFNAKTLFYRSFLPLFETILSYKL